MKQDVLPPLATTVAAVVAVGTLTWWLLREPALYLEPSVPGMDGKPEEASAADHVTIGERFAAFAGVPGGPPFEWPRFRGEAFDNICRQNVPLAVSFSKGLSPVWSVSLGEGYAGPAVRSGRVYVLDYVEQDESDALRCFSLADGQEIWRRAYRVPMKRNHGFSRTVPAVDGTYVVTIGPQGHTMCVTADNGNLLWGVDLVSRYGARIPGWYTGQCPLIDDGVAVLAPAGTNVLMVGIDCATGAVVWEAPNPGGWQMSHSSVMPMDLGGQRMYVYCAIGGIAGIAADGPRRGEILWKTSVWTPPVVAPSPLVLEDGRIFMTAGYGAGSIMLRIERQGESFLVHELYRHGPREGLACEQQTPVLWNGHLFGILPQDAGSLRRELVCYNLQGRLVWSSGKTERFGLGPFAVADGKLFILSDDGELTLVRADVEQFAPLAKIEVLSGRDAWAPMAFAGPYLLVRDSKTLVCLDIGAAEIPSGGWHR